MILACKSVKKEFPEKQVLKDCSFFVEEGEKVALIGVNGAGKTTLFRILTGESEPDGGEVIFAKSKTFGYLAQHQDLTASGTIYDYLLSTKQEIPDLEEKIRENERRMKNLGGEELARALKEYDQDMHRFEQMDGYAYRSEVVGVLKGLGFDEKDFGQDIRELSGGQKTRVSLGRLLLAKPDLILLDEPTNHLDMESVRWLETFLQSYRGAVIVAAHDRYFLDKIVTKVIEIENGEIMTFPGNYTAFREKKEIIRNAQRKAWQNEQQEIEHQQEVIAKLKSFNREKSVKRAESREKMLAKQLQNRTEKPPEEDSAMRLSFRPDAVSGQDVLLVEGLAKSFGEKHLFSGLDIQIRRGERVALIGGNGTGKTTILKIINGMVPQDAGIVRQGAKVKIGYFDQEHHTLHADKTVFDEIGDAYPAFDNTKIRNVLAAFLFTGEDVFKRVGDLSGGERGRLSLAKLMLSGANFLVLDEPTNHLDVTSREILEQALNEYTGTLLYVSHDRYFINRTATRILELENGRLTSWQGNYDYYMEKKNAPESDPAQDGKTGRISGDRAGERAAVTGKAGGKKIREPENTGASSDSADSGKPGVRGTTADGTAKGDWLLQKEEKARLRRRKNELEKTEAEITRLETRNEEIDRLFTEEEVFSDAARLLALQKEKEENELALLELYERWETLGEP
ncbi:MAG: ABC-F type ribosomal protection protein [Lachnospiraceae bacterium]|nr:ABC-F type ribosomal protection protein [Lachnospiraceae bacterium]